MLFIWGSGEGPDDTLTAVRPGGRRRGAEVNLETVILTRGDKRLVALCPPVPGKLIPLGENDFKRL